MVRVWEVQTAVALAAQLTGVGHVNVLRPLGIKKHQAAGYLRVICGNRMTGRAAYLRPNACVRG
jgi:hypothetical protein